MIVKLFDFATGLCAATAAAGGGVSSFVRKSTALVTPSETATKNDMSEMSAWFSPESAVAFVGFLLKSLLLPSARMPNTVPTPAAAIASPPVM